MVPVERRRAGVIVFGDINVDVLAPVDAFAGLGGDYWAPGLELHCGGVGANVALALAGWRVPVQLLGVIGADPLGQFLLKHLRRRRVGTALIQEAANALTGLMFTVVSPGGERTFFGSRGANAKVRPARNPATKWKGVKAVHLVGYCFLSRSSARAARALLAEARRQGALVSLDVGMGPARTIPRTILQAASQVDILFVSRAEAKLLTGKKDPRRGLEALEELGAGQVVVTVGRRGCLFRDNGSVVTAPGLATSVTDTTGCGDAFVAAFLYARLQNWSRAETMLLANAAGAAAAGVLGAGEQLPGPREILGLLARQRLAPSWEPIRRQVVQRLKKQRL
jgi:sugar/nucleoside kinase (ribokinase family)